MKTASRAVVPILAALVWVTPALAADAPAPSGGWSVGVIIAFFAGAGTLITVIGGVLVKVIVALRDTRVALGEIKHAASDLDKKVDGVKADVAQVHEATNGLSHRLAEASGAAGFGRGQETERKDERLRIAEAAAGTSAAPVDARAELLTKVEALLSEIQKLGRGPAVSEPTPPRDTLRNAVAAIQEKTDQLTFTKPSVVDAAEPPKRTEQGT